VPLSDCCWRSGIHQRLIILCYVYDSQPRRTQRGTAGLYLGEYTSQPAGRQLTLERLHLTDDTLTIELPFTKTNQLGQGREVSMGKTGTLTSRLQR